MIRNAFFLFPSKISIFHDHIDDYFSLLIIFYRFVVIPNKIRSKRFNVDARNFDNVKYTSQKGRLILDNGVPHFLQHCARSAGDTRPALCTESRIQKSRQRNDGRDSTSWRSSQLLLFFTFTNRCQCQCLRSPCAFVPRIMVIASRNDRAIRSLVAEIDAHHAG